ncbi:hypothetical protein [Legionella sp. km772]|uniref:hypothetical protein n=1 Tax=Legionella sp. km772 TaxID=2498111 RepID=UPI000F8F5A95|nr:hypothetical protein [Legionella sp. km772]RUR07522.1 hypothetical protein ELY15_12100 [Legionella sp. km772]
MKKNRETPRENDFPFNSLLDMYLDTYNGSAWNLTSLINTYSNPFFENTMLLFLKNSQMTLDYWQSMMNQFEAGCRNNRLQRSSQKVAKT